MWKPIEKDQDGFVTDIQAEVMYSNLPILIVKIYEGLYPTIEYINEDNWMDASKDFNRESCKYWDTAERITF